VLFPFKLPTATNRDQFPVELAASVLRGRWTTLVVLNLLEGPRRFFQLMRDIEGVSRQALAHCLDELERAGVVKRRFEDGEESRLEYGLTESGERLRYVIGAMYVWGLDAVRHGAPSEGAPNAWDPNTRRQEP
jgi:DNA-binding HxlR family transcriptional regulator